MYHHFFFFFLVSPFYREIHLPEVTQLGSDGVRNWQPSLPASSIHIHHQYDNRRANVQKTGPEECPPKCSEWLALRDETINSSFCFALSA